MARSGSVSDLERAKNEGGASCRHPAAPNRISAVGFNPYRRQRRRRSDYVFVTAPFVVVAILLLWALLPS